MAQPPVIHCFVAPEDYNEFRRISVDGDKWTPDYATFVKAVEEFLHSVQNKGGVAVKMYIKPAELVAWCREKGRPVDAHARAHYAATMYRAERENE